MRVTAADLERLRGTYTAQMAKLPVAAGGGRGRLTTPARTPQVGGPATSKHPMPKSAERKAKLRPRAPLEREIQRAILAFLNAQPGIYAWKAGAGLIPTADGRRVRMGQAGVADVIGWTAMHMIGGLGEMRVCRRPRGCYFSGHVPVWLGIEVKRPGQKATRLQLAFLARLKDAGSPLAMVASSVDEVRRAVEAL